MIDYIAINNEVYTILADDYYEKIINDSNYINIINSICERVYNKYISYNDKEPECFLELGPGLGMALDIFSVKYKCNVSGIELSYRMAEKAKKNAPRAFIIADNANNIHNLLEHQFDIIFANAFIHLFPLDDAIKILNNIRKWLSKNGVFYLSTTLHDKSEEGLFPKANCGLGVINRYRRKYEEHDFKSLVKDCGYKILDKWHFLDTKQNKNWINIICVQP